MASWGTRRRKSSRNPTGGTARGISDENSPCAKDRQYDGRCAQTWEKLAAQRERDLIPDPDDAPARGGNGTQIHAAALIRSDGEPTPLPPCSAVQSPRVLRQRGGFLFGVAIVFIVVALVVLIYRTRPPLLGGE
jgi:hypothetical protein